MSNIEYIFLYPQEERKNKNADYAFSIPARMEEVLSWKFNCIQKMKGQENDEMF